MTVRGGIVFKLDMAIVWKFRSLAFGSEGRGMAVKLGRVIVGQIGGWYEVGQGAWLVGYGGCMGGRWCRVGRCGKVHG